MFESLTQWAYGEPALDPNSPARLAASRQDIIRDEVQCCIQDVEDALHERAKEERRRVSKVDYSWLFPEERKRYAMPASISVRLAELAARLNGEECTACVGQFRRMVEGIEDVERIADVMLCIMEKTLADRPADPQSTSWRPVALLRRASQSGLNGVMSPEWADYVRANITSVKQAAVAPIGTIKRRLSQSLSSSSIGSLSLPSTVDHVSDLSATYYDVDDLSPPPIITGRLEELPI